MPLPYGFMLAPDGSVSIDHEKSNIVRAIYQQYLSGMSLKGITDFLFAQGILSPCTMKNSSKLMMEPM